MIFKNVCWIKACKLRLRKSNEFDANDTQQTRWPILCSLSRPFNMVNFFSSTDDGKRKQNFCRRGTQPTSSQNFWSNPLTCFINLIQEIQDFGVKLPMSRFHSVSTPITKLASCDFGLSLSVVYKRKHACSRGSQNLLCWFIFIMKQNWSLLDHKQLQFESEMHVKCPEGISAHDSTATCVLARKERNS